LVFGSYSSNSRAPLDSTLERILENNGKIKK
jgi:hypothetical protein